MKRDLKISGSSKYRNKANYERLIAELPTGISSFVDRDVLLVTHALKFFSRK